MSMTYQEIAQMLDDLGVPYAYYQFTEGTAQEPPFICFYYPGIDDLYADNSNYQRITQLVIEVYTDNKDFALEARVESALSDAGLTYNKTETYIDEERLYMVTYESEVTIHG